MRFQDIVIVELVCLADDQVGAEDQLDIPLIGAERTYTRQVLSRIKNKLNLIPTEFLSLLRRKLDYNDLKKPFSASFVT